MANASTRPADHGHHPCAHQLENPHWFQQLNQAQDFILRTGDLNNDRFRGYVDNFAGNRDARLEGHIRADFEYDNGVEAALGPFASIDRVELKYTFNG